MSPQDQLLLTPEEAAEVLNTSARHLRSLREFHGLPAVKLGRKVRYRRCDLERYIDQNLDVTSVSVRTP